MLEEDKVKMMLEMPYTKYPFQSFKIFLQESISIKSLKYGDNFPKFNNNKIEVIQGTRLTYFMLNSLIYVVIIKDNKEVMFSKVKNFENFEFYDGLTFDRNQFKVFGSVMYTVIEMMKKLQYSQVYFDGLTPKHTTIYEKLWNNKYVINEVTKYNISLEIRINQMKVKKFYIIEGRE